MTELRSRDEQMDNNKNENTQTESEKVDDEVSNTEIEQLTMDESAEEVGI